MVIFLIVCKWRIIICIFKDLVLIKLRKSSYEKGFPISFLYFIPFFLFFLQRIADDFISWINNLVIIF